MVREIVLARHERAASFSPVTGSTLCIINPGRVLTAAPGRRLQAGAGQLSQVARHALQASRAPSSSAAACVELLPPYQLSAGPQATVTSSRFQRHLVTRKAEPVNRLAGPADDLEPKSATVDTAPLRGD